MRAVHGTRALKNSLRALQESKDCGDDASEDQRWASGAHVKWVGPNPERPSLPLAGSGGFVGNQDPGARGHLGHEEEYKRISKDVPVH